MITKLLSKEEYLQTMSGKAKPSSISGLNVDIDAYVGNIPVKDFGQFVPMQQKATLAYEVSPGHCAHVLVRTNDNNVFLVVIIDLLSGIVCGHHLLNLNKEYGLSTEVDGVEHKF